MNRLLELSHILGNNTFNMARFPESQVQASTEYSWLPFLNIDGFLEIISTRYEYFAGNNTSLQLLNQPEYQEFIARIGQRICSAEQPRRIVDLNENFKDPKELMIGELLYRQALGGGKLQNYNDYNRIVNASLLGINRDSVSIKTFNEIVRYVAQY